jgi:hypothetical protein
MSVFAEVLRNLRAPMISPQSYRLDNRNYAGSTEESDEEEVTLHRRKTTTERSQR